MISFLIYWLLAERFSSGKRFRQDFYPHSAFSSFSCFKTTFLGTFSSGQIGTSLLPGRMVYILELLFSLGEWFTFWNFSSPWENGSVFQLASIFLPKSKVSLEIHVWGYVKKATQKQRFAQCVDIDLSMIFLNFGQLLFSIK